MKYICYRYSISTISKSLYIHYMYYIYTLHILDMYYTWTGYISTHCVYAE